MKTISDDMRFYGAILSVRVDPGMDNDPRMVAEFIINGRNESYIVPDEGLFGLLHKEMVDNIYMGRHGHPFERVWIARDMAHPNKWEVIKET